jgi:hypothetical protein
MSWVPNISLHPLWYIYIYYRRLQKIIPDPYKAEGRQPVFLGGRLAVDEKNFSLIYRIEKECEEIMKKDTEKVERTG